MVARDKLGEAASILRKSAKDDPSIYSSVEKIAVAKQVAEKEPTIDFFRSNKQGNKYAGNKKQYERYPAYKPRIYRQERRDFDRPEVGSKSNKQF